MYSKEEEFKRRFIAVQTERRNITVSKEDLTVVAWVATNPDSREQVKEIYPHHKCGFPIYYFDSLFICQRCNEVIEL